MHPLRLVRIAIEAELLRLGLHARRMATRAAMGCVALVLLLGAIGFGHVAAWYWLRDFLPGQTVALIFAGVDLLFALVLGVLAFRSAPGRAELEALEVRRHALEQAVGSVTVSALLIQLLRQLVRATPRS